MLIRWCLDRDFVVIPKSVREQRIVENGDVFDFQLSPEDLQSMVGTGSLKKLFYCSTCVCTMILYNMQSGLKSEELVLGWNPLASPWEP